MRVIEDVQLTHFERPSSWYMKLVSASDYDAKDLGDSVILRAPYESGRYEALLRKISESGLSPKLYRGFSTEWSDDDFARADLLALTLADLDIDGFYEEAKCSHCDRGTAKRDYGKRVQKVRSKHKLGTAGIWATVVHTSVKDQAERELRGLKFIPFDDTGECFYLTETSELQQQTICPEDGVDVGAACPACNRYQYGVFFGPLRYRRAGWNGDDVVYSYFADTLLFTPRAYELLRSFDREVRRAAPVYLES